MEGPQSDRALLIAGPVVSGGAARPSLAPLAEALRAGGSAPAIRQAEPGIGPGALTRAVEVAAAATGVCWYVAVGAVRGGDDGLALVLDGADDRVEAWPLRGLHRTGAAATVTIAIIDATPEVSDAAVLAALGDVGLRVAVATHDRGAAALDALVAGLRGAALDLRRGAITARSLAAHFAAVGAQVALPAGDAADLELFEPPSLERLWRLGWSVAAGRTAPSTGSDDPALGTVLPGRFRLDARLAEGGFGIVYRARQLAIGRDVAVKVMRAGIDPFSEDGRLFVQEIQAVGRIDHANVVRVYQADVTADGRLFFAMELLDGRDLQAQVEAGPTPLADAVALVAQLLAGLDAAHRAGLVHADVKPGNVIVSGGRAVLVDFGLARLRRADEAATAIGGTPAYMAPEQLEHERVDARSDLFAAALVLVALVTGWRRTRAADLAPPPEVLARIDDARVRDALARALAIDPAARFATAAAFAATLIGTDVSDAALPERPPFHGLASFDERDDGLLFGRDRELAQLSELVLHRRVVIVTAPSGVGKTSLLRAGLRPRLEALAVRVAYASCRTEDAARLGVALVPGSVVLLDQVETALDPNDATAAAVLDAVLVAAHRDDPITAVVSVREDFLARLLDRAGARVDGAPIVRIGPLAPDGARDAILRPLAERRLAIAPDLLERLLADLVAAGRQLGAELGWGALEPIYPPHLQLACSVLYDRLPTDAATLTLALYQQLGGFDAIVGEHLDRVLDGLDAIDGAIARDLFLALVTVAHGRSARSEAELTDVVGAGAARMPAVLEHLRRQGLVVRVRRADGDAVWELIHDSLVPRVQAWIDRRDLSRRRAIELVRYHLRRSQPRMPSLLSRAELRELAPHADAIAALDAEWRRAERGTHAEPTWTPAALVARSRQVQRRVTLAAIALVATVIAGVGAAVFERWRSANDRKAELARRDRDLGLIAFEFAPFDWNVDKLEPIDVPISDLPDLRWAIHTVKLDPDTDVEDPGDPYPAERFRLLSSELLPGGTRLDTAEASGGPAFLVISGRNRAGEPDCGPSIIPIRALPGYPQRKLGHRPYPIPVPTCQVSQADTIYVAAGPFCYSGGIAESAATKNENSERCLVPPTTIPGFSIDRTELSNAVVALTGPFEILSGVRPPRYPRVEEFANASEPKMPAAGLSLRDARFYCRYLGRQLPSPMQWEKAMRGGLSIPTDAPDNSGDSSNRYPQRSFPWKPGSQTDDVSVLDESAAPSLRPVGSSSTDRSPYGVCDLAGSLQEWTSHTDTDGFQITRGGNWATSTRATLRSFTINNNPRLADSRSYELGARCVSIFARRSR
ncbi:MAG: SUMF1/EgtB/PvdO family nonheme iron enzyme [Myxococcales bacterium]|nr:SUMF1/EgtB/PvdO family nonheme iron enzyme [Myxococcales bacterium]